MKLKKLLTVVVVALALFISACASQDSATDTTTADSAQDSVQTQAEPTAKPEEKKPDPKPTEAPKEEPTATPVKEEPKDDHYPYTFENCGVEVTLDKAPERIVLLNSAPVVALDELGVIDRVISRGGEFPEAYYSDSLNNKLADIEGLTSDTDSSGHLVISLESVLESEPDLVFASESETINRDNLKKAGVTLFTDPSFCKGGKKSDVSYENIYSTIETYGEMFDREDEANNFIDALKERTDKATESPALPEGSTAAALYVESDGGKIWAYGPKSMTHPQMESLGATNVFADAKDRVFDVNIEELIDRDPDMLILLYGDPDLSEQDVIDMLLDMPGADRLSAVQKGQAFPHLFNFSEPATPLVIDGLEMLAGRIETATPAPAPVDNHYPYTFENCGVEVTLDKAPERIVLLNSAPVVALDELGVIDRVISRGGEFPKAYYSDSLNKKLADIEGLTSDTDSSGHLVISLESVLESEPDLVFASESETINRDNLEKAGVTLFTDPSFCKGGKKSDVSYENIYSTIETYGEMFDREDEANNFIGTLKERTDKATESPALPEGSTAAALYVESDGGKIWAYGPKSMTHPQMESLGATNVFADAKDRVFDVNIEELIDRDPDMLILLYGDPELGEQDVIDMLLDMPGADRLSAVTNNLAFPHLFNFSEPATPLVIDGLDMLAGRIGEVSPAASSPAVTEYPYTFENCGVEVTLEKAPERIVLLNSAPVVALDELGVIDRVISRGGEFPKAYYSDSLNKKLADIEALTSDTDSSGHLVISLESVLESEPDLVFASESETINRDNLEKAGVTLFTDPSFCKGGKKSDVSYENIYSTIETYGEMFDRQDDAAFFISELETRIEKSAKTPALEKGSTAAALYVESDGGKIWAYGPKSMTHPQMESLGATNVFADAKDRVFDVNIEELIDRDPDMLILLYGDPDLSEQDVIDMLLDMPGADRLSAVKNDLALPHLFNFSEPATPLVIDGLEMLHERIDG